MSTVLVVDDKEMMRDSVAATLRRAGFEVLLADGGEAALGMVARHRPDVVVTDLRMPELSGLDLLERLRRIDEDLPVLVMTAYAEVDSAVRAMKLGAFDYLTKPFEGDELIIAVKRAVAHASLRRENAVLRAASGTGASAAGPRLGLDRLIGDSPPMRRVREQVLAVAESAGTVLICGESGSGKEVVARAIHESSPRRDRPFLAVNCAALSESLLESELFGHEKGAFTGADRLRRGRFELAHGGTLLLDEVSEIGPHIQAKLLRVLQERSFERVGSSVSLSVDVRVIATSNRDLPQSVARGDFRQDLFFRLNVLPIHLPPLRDRLEDVPALTAHFVAEICAREGRAPVIFDDQAMALMQQYYWPGNVRELQNICERAVVLATARGFGHRSGVVPAPGGGRRNGPVVIGRDTIEPWLIGVPVPPITDSARAGPAWVERPSPPAPISSPSPGTLGARADVNGQTLNPPVVVVRPLEEVEREAILAALKRFNGHRQKTAAALGIGVRTLGLKLKKWKEQNLIPEAL